MTILIHNLKSIFIKSIFMKHLSIRRYGLIQSKPQLAVLVSLIYDIPLTDQFVADISYRALGDMLVSALRSDNFTHIQNRKTFHIDISQFIIPPYYL